MRKKRALKKRYMRTLLTEEEVKVLDMLEKYEKVTEAAMKLGKAQPTISIAKRRIEDKLDMAIQTVKLGVQRGLISEDDLLRIIISANLYERLKKQIGRRTLSNFLRELLEKETENRS